MAALTRPILADLFGTDEVLRLSDLVDRAVREGYSSYAVTRAMDSGLLCKEVIPRAEGQMGRPPHAVRLAPEHRVTVDVPPGMSAADVIAAVEAAARGEIHAH